MLCKGRPNQKMMNSILLFAAGMIMLFLGKGSWDIRQAFLLLLVSLFRRRIGNVGVVCHLTVGALDDVSILIRFRCLGLGDSSGLRLLPGDAVFCQLLVGVLLGSGNVEIRQNLHQDLSGDDVGIAALGLILHVGLIHYGINHHFRIVDGGCTDKGNDVSS